MSQAPFAAANKAAVDSLLAMANTLWSASELIATLNLNTARSFMEDGLAGGQAILGAKDAQEAAGIQQALTQPAINKAVIYARSMGEISAQTQAQMGRLLEAQMGDAQHSMTTFFSGLSQSAPLGSENAMAVMQGALQATNTAIANMNSFTKQFAKAA